MWFIETAGSSQHTIETQVNDVQKLCRELSSVPTLIDFDETEIEHSLLSLNRLCPLPDTLPFPFSFKTIAHQLLDTYIELDQQVNTLLKSHIAVIRKVIDGLCDAADSIEAFIPAKAERNELQSILTLNPEYCTLLFIQSFLDRESQKAWLTFFVRLQNTSSDITYQQWLEFDKVRRRIVEFPIQTDELTKMSNLKLASYCKDNSDLSPFSHLLIRVRKRPNKPNPRLPFKSDNEHVKELTTLDGRNVTVFTPADIEGNDSTPFFHQNECDELLNSPALTKEQAKRKYRQAQAGIENAIARANRSLPMVQSALTPSEVSAWLHYHCPEFFEHKMNQTIEGERSYWFLFFFNLFTGKTNINPLVFNENSKSDDLIDKNTSHAYSLFYKLDRKSSCTAFLRIGTALFKGKQPDKGSKHYYSTKSFVDINLPYPLCTLLSLILRALPSCKRDGDELQTVLSVKPSDLRDWLKKKSKATKSNFSFKVTPSRLFRSFHSFANQKMPSVYRQYLQRNSSVIMHYSNFDTTSINRSLYESWFEFLKVLGMSDNRDWSTETKATLIDDFSYHDHIGSAITLRERLLPDVFHAILSPLVEAELASLSSSEICHRLAIYIHIRAAIELALRPVAEPYARAKDIAWNCGVMTVQDKRVHHSEEKRVIVLSPELVEVLKTYQVFCKSISAEYQENKTACLSVLLEDKWQSLSSRVLNQLYKQYLAPLEHGTFRHLSAHQVTQLNNGSNNQFRQELLNQKMNHYKRGQNPLSQFSLCSISRLASIQKALQSEIESLSSNPDVLLSWKAIRKWDKEACKVMASFKRRHCRV
ncbi:hypothetical protein L4D20_03665 [Vibrio kyushuensis]|uniref:hypothetical protein n=1 Tax=Vibrio kyushuensis TaxID=2910249 RepID=UPI003D110C1D